VRPEKSYDLDPLDDVFTTVKPEDFDWLIINHKTRCIDASPVVILWSHFYVMTILLTKCLCCLDFSLVDFGAVSYWQWQSDPQD
jgi:hypothetical protein